MTRFWRDPPISVGWSYFVGGWLCLVGVAALVERHWFLGLTHLAVAYVSIMSTRFALRTPIIELTSEELVVKRGYFSSPVRIPIRDVQQLDRSRPSRLTLAVRGRKDFVIPLDWLRWEDRPKFISALVSLVGATGK